MTKAIENSYYNREINDVKLSKDELLFFKKALEAKKIKLQENLTIASNNLKSEDHCNAKDEADHASSTIDINTANAVIKEQNKSMNQINRCLNKIEFGRYGICNMCEELINIERLKVKIFAEHCISCRELIEKGQR